MRRRNPNYDHEHEWHPEDMTGEGIILEDGGAYFRYQCDWAPVLSSQHSEKHDETFREYGEPCGASRSIRLDPTEDLPAETIREIELAWQDGDLEVMVCDPPRPRDESGKLVVKHGTIVVTYERDE